MLLMFTKVTAVAALLVFLNSASQAWSNVVANGVLTNMSQGQDQVGPGQAAETVSP